MAPRDTEQEIVQRVRERRAEQLRGPADGSEKTPLDRALDALRGQGVGTWNGGLRGRGNFDGSIMVPRGDAERDS